jgi:hypothetical protein
MVDRSGKWSTSDEGDSSKSENYNSGLDPITETSENKYLVSRSTSMIKNWPVNDQVAHLAEITTRRHGTVAHLSLVHQISLNPIFLGLISKMIGTDNKRKIKIYLAVAAQRFSFVCVHGLSFIKHPLVSHATNVIFKRLQLYFINIGQVNIVHCTLP